MFTTPFTLRSGDVLKVVHYDSSTTRIPSMVAAKDVGVSDPVTISGTVEVEREYIYAVMILYSSYMYSPNIFAGLLPTSFHPRTTVSGEQSLCT